MISVMEMQRTAECSPATIRRAAIAPSSEPRTISILVIDDIEANRYAMTRWLEKAGFEVMEAGTGQEGLRLAREQPDLIILDINLPDCIGFDVCRELKNNSETAAIPVLQVSATLRRSIDRVRGLEAGADGYLAGPIEPLELLANVRLLLRLRESQESLRRSEAGFRHQAELLDVAHDAIVVRDLEGRIEFWNRGAERLYGCPQQEAIGRITHILFQTIFPVSLERVMEQVFREGTWRGELIHSCCGGPSLVVDSRWVLRRDGSGQPCAILEIGRDITDRKRAEEALRQSEEEFRVSFEASAIGKGQADPATGRFVRVNRTFCEMTGYSQTELFQKTFSEITHPDDRAADQKGFRRLLSGEIQAHRIQKRYVRKDGTIIWVYLSANLLHGVAGMPDRFNGAVVDITEWKRAEESLRRTSFELEQTRAELARHAQVLEIKVMERTTELADSNRKLKVEVAERTRIEQDREALLRGIVNAQEEERRRISRELHDRTGQHLTAFLLGLKRLGNSLGEVEVLNARVSESVSQAANAWQPILDQLLKLADQMGRELHDMAFELRPTALDDVGLRSTLRTHLRAWSEQSGIQSDFQSIDYDGRDIPPEVETNLYRVAQEALTNVLKHAQARHVCVILERVKGRAGEGTPTSRSAGRGSVRLIIEDDGRGFDLDALLDSPAAAGRIGILGMKERLAFVGGTLSIESNPESGTTLFARIPVPR